MIVMYLSRPLSDTETRDSQIEKEALAVLWACERLDTEHISLLATFCALSVCLTQFLNKGFCLYSIKCSIKM